MDGRIEHVNFTVPDPDRTAAWMCDVFGWTVRWRGEAINGGYTVHVGSEDQYLAIYTGPGGQPQASAHVSYRQIGGLNHVGIVVDNIDATEKRITALGFSPEKHADYEPGQRFYFRDENDVEFEIVSYT